MKVSWDDDIPNIYIYRKIKAMFQTTNQYIYIYIHTYIHIYQAFSEGIPSYSEGIEPASWDDLFRRSTVRVFWKIPRGSYFQIGNSWISTYKKYVCWRVSPKKDGESVVFPI